MIGKGGMTGANAVPSADPSFSPYLAARNRSDKPLTISPIFRYDNDDKTVQVKLPAITLSRQQSTVLNLREFQEKGTIPSWVEMGNLDLQYKGEAGALIAELASVDRNGSFVGPVRLICDGAQASTMSFWRTDGDWHSALTIENIASQENDMEITVSYPGGIYLLEKRIAAGATVMVSINDLQQSQEPDREGRRIPKDATLGGVNIWSPDIRNGLVINAMLMNPVTKTCGQCYEPGYVTAYAVSDKQADSISLLYSGFDPHPVSQGFSIWLNVHYSMGTQGGLTPNFSSSSNQSVATATQGFGFTVNVATANITARGDNFFTDQACSQLHSITPTSSLSVVPQVRFQKSDGSGLPNPLRVGISASTLGGTLHNRTQHLRAVITPASQAASVTISANNKLTVTQGSTSNGVISFDVVEKNQSANHGDATIKANYPGAGVIATAAVDVIVPHNVSGTHDTTGGGPVIANMVLDATTSPGWQCLPTGQVHLVTFYGRYLTVTVCDQFGGLIGDLYQGAEVSEYADCDLQFHSLNQPLSSASTYSDPDGGGIGGRNVAAGSVDAMNWPSQPKIPAPAVCTPGPVENVRVGVDGFELTPGIANRRWTICGDGSRVTSPPVTITISWP